ncbi:MAG TPA: LysR family transcriptional regulator [Sphingomicrobium sp.]|jgi:DNA-binding transcriptional LysR family regulator|nr:LysR family transcriptional regulator [Sphingomicrobium sp.]
MLDWNDLRFFLTVARDGSTLAASRRLRLSQTTVARRIAALERALGLALFERRQGGYALTPAGEDLLPLAERVEAEAQEFADAAGAQTRQHSGTVRITSEDIYAIGLLSPLLRDLHERFPDIMIDLDMGQQMRDLGKGEADIALRSSSKDQPAGLVGRMLCKDDWTLYCSRAYAERHGAPASVEELKNHAIVGGGGGNLWRHYQAWLQQLGLEEQVAMHHANSTGLLTAVRSGFGIAVLPTVVADADPDLIRCIAPRADHGRILWLLTHERVRRTPRVRAVIDFLYDGLSRHVRELEAKRAAA